MRGSPGSWRPGSTRSEDIGCGGASVCTSSGARGAWLGLGSSGARGAWLGLGFGCLARLRVRAPG